MKSILSLIIGISIFITCTGQTTKFSCSETQRKDLDSKYPTIIQTCFLNNFKFVTTSYPDYVGRYFYSEYEVYIRTQKGYVKTTNSNVFNQSQNKLVEIINKRIQQDFRDFLADSTTRGCLTDIDSIPQYKMNDFDISFYKNDIWFEVHWGLSSACRAVDGTIVSFKVDEIKHYLK